MTTVVVNAHPAAVEQAVESLCRQGLSTSVTGLRNTGELRYLKLTGPTEEVLHREDPRGRFNLTTRQVEILAYLATGHTRGQIARRMGVKASTVRTHMRHLYRRMGVANLTSASAAAVLLGYRHGYLTTNDTVQEGHQQ